MVTKEEMEGDLVVSTGMLLSMAMTADRLKLNRRLVTEKLATHLDPNGVHIVIPMLLHNESEMRVRILMKENGSMEPVEGWLDIPLDKPKGQNSVNWDDVKKHSDLLIEELVKDSINDINEKLKNDK